MQCYCRRMVNCTKCGKEFERNVFCSASCKTMYHRKLKLSNGKQINTEEIKKEELRLCKHGSMIGLCKKGCQTYLGKRFRKKPFRNILVCYDNFRQVGWRTREELDKLLEEGSVDYWIKDGEKQINVEKNTEIGEPEFDS